MTTRLPPQCLTCVHWVPGTPETSVPTCGAYAGGIPDEIWWNQTDHRQPAEGDHGIQWESIGDGIEFPAWAVDLAR